MPITKKVQYTEEELSNTSTTADGTDFVDIVGYKPKIICEWDYIPQNILLSLFSLKGFVEVKYPDIDGTFKTDTMRISIRPSVSIFRYVNGTPVWHSIQITLTSRTVR